MEKSFIMLVGLPGSGKSTLAAEKYQSDPDAVVISSDKFLEDIAAQRNISYSKAFAECMGEANAECFNQARKAFAEGKKVVWDQPNLTIDDRARRLDLVPDDYFKAALSFELDKAELADRFVARFHQTGKSVSPAAMDQMSKSYERPGRFEGFDYIDIITI